MKRGRREYGIQVHTRVENTLVFGDRSDSLEMDSFVGSVCESEGRETTTPVKIDKALQHPQQLLLRVAVQEANEAADQAAVAKGIGEGFALRKECVEALQSTQTKWRIG